MIQTPEKEVNMNTTERIFPSATEKEMQESSSTASVGSSSSKAKKNTSTLNSIFWHPEVQFILKVNRKESGFAFKSGH